MKDFHYACGSTKVEVRDFIYYDEKGKIRIIKDLHYCSHCQRFIESYDVIRPAMRLEEFGHMKERVKTGVTIMVK